LRSLISASCGLVRLTDSTAPLRYLIDRGIRARDKTVFPWGTLAANVTACLALAFVLRQRGSRACRGRSRRHPRARGVGVMKDPCSHYFLITPMTESRPSFLEVLAFRL
jgi:hypothetical protein